MLQQLINLSPDLKKLWEEGYEMELKGKYLMIHHIPYLNSSKEIVYGSLATFLNYTETVVLPQPDHTAYFIGEPPFKKNGKVMDAIINHSNPVSLVDGIIGNHYLSSKPGKGKYDDYYEKVSTYVNIISAPAKSLDSSVTEKTYKVTISDAEESVFNYPDTNAARSCIDVISNGIKGQKVAIIGLGGTGSYILDLVVKTPVDFIHAFDGDIYKQNNAFRAPGAPSMICLQKRFKKTDYFKSIYSNMHRNIVSHPYYVDNTNLDELAEMDFIFLCIDNGESKKLVINYLLANNIPFIDVGMGVQRVENQLLGIVRVTTSTEIKNDHLSSRITFAGDARNEYGTNIQIAELNALNATLAVIKWKKLYGFYQDFENENHSTYSINVNLLTSDDHAA